MGNYLAGIVRQISYRPCTLIILMHGSVAFEREVGLLAPTYVTATTKLTLAMTNLKTEFLKYEWRKFGSEAEESEILRSCDLSDPEQRAMYPELLKFESDVFAIESMSGKVWPGQSEQFVVVFRPKLAVEYEETAYLYDTVTKERTPYVLKGVGLPPTVAFDVAEINIGHVLLDSDLEYRVKLMNVGDVEVSFEYVERQVEHLKFDFSPKSGKLAKGESVAVSIRFLANYVGQFSESFSYRVVGVEDGFAKVSLYGRVIGPSFSLNRESVNFGTLSFGFLYSEEIVIENTSDIAFDYALKLEPDPSFDAREFSITPSYGSIPKKGKHVVKVEFIPIFIQQYHVTLNIEGVKFGEILARIPITATCLSPPVSLEQDLLDLGSLFINHEYTFTLGMANDTDFPAKFEFLETDDPSTLDASLHFPKIRGVIGAHSVSRLPIRVKPMQLGHITLHRCVKTFGSDGPPMQYTLKMLCTGPKIEFSTNLVDFGTVNVLDDIVQDLYIKNNSLITTSYTIDIQNDSIFRAEPRQATIGPGETLVMKIVANLNDVITFTGKIIFRFEYLSPIIIDLKARGKGTTIVSTIDMTCLCLGNVFTVEPTVRRFVLHNKGRRSQELKWVQQKAAIEGPNGVVFSYRVEPESKVLQPNEKCSFTFTFNSNLPCKFQVTPVCSATLARQRFDLFKPMITGTYVKPILQLESTEMVFRYVHDVQREEELTGHLRTKQLIEPSKELLQPITLKNSFTNNSELPLIFNVKVSEPFSISKCDFHLGCGESDEIFITFDPSFKRNFASETIVKKLEISFEDNPHKYSLDLRADMLFPNLAFDPASEIDFGVLLLHTEETKVIRTTNTSEVTAEFFWELQTENVEGRIFDIYPIRGSIPPGETQDIHATFFAGARENDHENTVFGGTAVCHVIGGPEYVIKLHGESAEIGYSLEPRNFDFGQRLYNDVITDKFVLTNSSNVPISFVARIPRSHNDVQFLDVQPTSGTLNCNERQEFVFRLLPGAPKSWSSAIAVQVGQFEEIHIELQVDCYSPQMLFTMPRHPQDPLINLKHADDKKYLENERRSLTSKFLEKMKAAPITSCKKAKKVNLSSLRRFKGFVLSTFLVDFGEIVFGQTPSLTYELESVAPDPISFEFLTTTINNTGFFISTTSFRDIPPHERLEFTISFDANRATVPCLGNVDFEVPVVFNEDVGYIIVIHANLKLPQISFSKMHLNFDSTIVGQRQILALQIQNTNAIDVEYTIGDAEYVNVIQRNKPGREPKVFIATPTQGVLPASSFRNIEVAFIPAAEKSYAMQFPITIKHNKEQYLISLKGNGVKLKVQFDPPELNFGTIQPFLSPAERTFDVVNVSTYPVEVYSLQFDFNLLCNSLEKQMKEIRGEVDEEQTTVVSDESPTMASKFSMCVIINGPTKSGKTTVAGKVAEYMGGVPVISLKEVWGHCLGLPDSDAHYSGVLKAEISKPKYVNGFVIDGIDVMKEPSENEQFMTHFLKQKNTLDELARNPFTVLAHPYVSALEQVMSYILSALDGQYVYLINLNANENTLKEHQMANETEEKQKKSEEISREMKALFEMTEEEYEQLTDEEKIAVDEKREQYRQYRIEHENDAAGYEPVAEPKTPNTRMSTRARDRQANRGRGKTIRGGLPADPLLQSVIFFEYTVGRLTELVKSGTTFTSLHPSRIRTVTTKAVSDVPLMSTTKTLKKFDESNIITSLASENSLYVNVLNTVDGVMHEIEEYLPTPAMIKEAAATKLIPKSQLKVPDTSDVSLLEMPANFVLVNEEPPGEFPESVLPQPPAKGNKQAEPDLTEGIDVMSYTKRWLIQPNERVTLKVRFDATSLGSYADHLLFSVAGSVGDAYKLPLRGQCALPDIVREVTAIFPRCVAKFKQNMNNIYDQSEGQFNFGPLLIIKDKQVRNKWAYHANIQLRNDGKFPSEITAELQVVGGKAGWALEGGTQTIAPNETGNITLHFNPTAVDVYKNRVTVYVKDNPEPMYLNIVAEGTIPTMALSTNTLDFEKLLIDQERSMKLTLKNTGKLPLHWRFKGENVLGNLFTFSALDGPLNPGATTLVTVTYSSPKQFAIKKSIQIDILDKNKARVFGSQHVTIIAETFEVLFDLQFPKGMDSLRYGFMKIGQKKAIACTLKNKGKYPVNCAINFAKPNLQRLFTVTPESSTVQPGDKGIAVNFEFLCKRQHKYLHSKGLTLSIIDSISNEPSASIPIPFSADVVYSSFKVSEDVINFGAVSISQAATKEFTIQNTGAFPFDFEITPKVEVIEPPPLPPGAKGRGKKEKAPKKSPRQPAARGKPKKGGSFQIGNFLVSNVVGSLQPGASCIVSCSFTSPSEGGNNNTVMLKVSDSNPKEYPDGFPIQLRADCFGPAIETSNYELIFPGTPLCLRHDIFVQETTAFLEDDLILHFAPLINQNKASVKVALVNPLPIPCTVDLFVKPKVKGQSVKQFPFELSEKTVEIGPSSTYEVELSFNPTTSETYNGQFEAHVKGSISPTGKLLKFGVEGSGATPSINLVQAPEPVDGVYSYVFGKTLLNCSRERTVLIENVGQVPVGLTVNATGSPDFEILDLNTVQEIVVNPAKRLPLTVKYAPTAIRKGTFEVFVEVKDNPANNFKMVFTGEGFREDVVFEGMENNDNELVFKDVVVGRQQQVKFMMRNVSKFDSRFVWTNLPDVTFCPRIGQLRAQSSKEITATFFSEKPTKVNGLKVTCQWTKIKMKEANPPDWDDSMKMVKFVERGALVPAITVPQTPVEERPKGTPRRFPAQGKRKAPTTPVQAKAETTLQVAFSSPRGPEHDLIKVVEIKDEPEYEVLPEKPKDFILKVFAVSDFIKFQTTENEIEFPPTMMFEKRIISFKIANTSQIRFEYSWVTTEFTALRTAYQLYHPCPFSIEPQSGCIEAGQTTKFSAIFMPEEVDDFMAKMKCDIPFLHKVTPPEISLTGRSRRPICHFNIKMSDYLSAGRRHPNYTDQLPDGVKVIEMFARKIGEKTTSTFEIINTTETPYEVMWTRVGDRGDESVTCNTPRVFISSGKRHVASFSFEPTSVKTIESLWHFSVPEHEINIYLLIVGRIMPY